MKVIGLAGPAGCGKDTVAGYAADYDRGMRLAFGDPIRRVVAQIFGLSDQQMGDRELKEQVIPELGLSPRQIMQRVGTEGGRDVFGEDIWIRVMKRRISELPPTGFVVISDVRTEAEAAFVREQGVVVHVVRNGIAEVSAHSTEAGIAYQDGDQVQDNSCDLMALKDAVLVNKPYWLSLC